jgi:hypothetical protein
MIRGGFMSITETSPARQIRVEVYEAGSVTRVADPQKRASTVLRNISLYIVPRVIEDRGVSIAKLAYLKAERRGFRPGHELEDWLAAENEVDQRLAGEGRVF